jgi:mono/diheme cytochrome c family protein
MNRLSSLKLRLRAGASLAVVAAAIYAASIAFVTGADTKTADSKVLESKPAGAKPAKKAEKKKLTAAELYTINCNRCHAERYPTEFTSGQWKTLMTHMRVRANLPAAQAKQIIKYLQEDSGN